VPDSSNYSNNPAGLDAPGDLLLAEKALSNWAASGLYSGKRPEPHGYLIAKALRPKRLSLCKAIELLDGLYVPTCVPADQRSAFLAAVRDEWNKPPGQGFRDAQVKAQRANEKARNGGAGTNTSAKATEATPGASGAGNAEPVEGLSGILSGATTGGRSARAERLILNPGEPYISANEFVTRHATHASGMTTLVCQEGTFYGWRGTHYAEVTQSEIDALLWRFLNQAQAINPKGVPVPFSPTTAKVSNVAAGLKAGLHLSSRVRSPAWRPGLEGGLPPNELVACANGLLHVPTRNLHPHTPAFFTLNALPFDYSPNASEPTGWLSFLEELWPDDVESREVLQEIFGLLLTGDTSFQKAFLLVGPKRCGKGTIGRILAALLGQENVCGPTLTSLSTNFGLAPLIGKRVALVADARLSGREDQGTLTERILGVTGEDLQTIDRKFLTPWQGKLDTRFVMMTNILPRLADASGALASRFIILKFTQSFFGREDLGLVNRLLPELPGILNWALDGLARLKARGYFIQPASAKELQNQLEALGSPVSAFLTEKCAVGPDQTIVIDALYRAWQAWCLTNGRRAPGSSSSFSTELHSVLPALTLERPRDATGKQVRTWRGVALNSPAGDFGGVAVDVAVDAGEVANAV
jgi:putative DNA primase/helicase